MSCDLIVNHLGVFSEKSRLPSGIKIISLDLSLNSDLIWEKVEEQITDGSFLFWHLDFGLGNKNIALDNEAVFASFLLGIKAFIERLWEPYRSFTVGAALYQGPLDYYSLMQWDAAFEEDYERWRGDYKKVKNPTQFYALEILAEYLHRLAARLPEELPLFALFDAKEVKSPSYLAKLLSKETFPYIHIGVENSPFPIGILKKEGNFLKRVSFDQIKLGVSLPLIQDCTSQALEEIDTFLAVLKSKNIPYRLISETYLTEEWDGLDDCIMFSSLLSSQGIRKAKGFIAAGGRIVVSGKSLGLSNEISIEAFLA